MNLLSSPSSSSSSSPSSILSAYAMPLYFPTLLGISFAAGIGIILLLQAATGINATISNQNNALKNGSNNNFFDNSNNQLIPLAADRIRNEPESVWVEFIQLALDYKPLNLGQGFPDFSAPKYLIESLHNATDDTLHPQKYLNNQYTRSFGHPRLIKALASYYKGHRDFKKLNEPNEQVLITVGAYEALFCSIMAFVSPGDEVLIIDPAFDAYKPMVEIAQGRPVYVPLRLTDKSKSSYSVQLGQKDKNSSDTQRVISSAGYELDMAEFAQKITNKTKVLILNTPNNPLGKMYSRSELRSIANICKEHNILVIADEVYEQMFYDNQSNHLSISQMPGMWDRTITIGSAGKTFSVTGWKIGWALGPKHLMRYLQLIHQTAIYTVATPLQEAVAQSFENEIDLMSKNKSNYWDELRDLLYHKRNRIVSILLKANMIPIIPQGGYFILVDFSPFAKQFKEQYELEGEAIGKPNTNDYKFVRWLSKTKGLQGIPASAFYSPMNKPLAENLVRFCFIKQDSTLEKLEILIEKLMPTTNTTTTTIKPVAAAAAFNSDSSHKGAGSSLT